MTTAIMFIHMAASSLWDQVQSVLADVFDTNDTTLEHAPGVQKVGMSTSYQAKMSEKT